MTHPEDATPRLELECPRHGVVSGDHVICLDEVWICLDDYGQCGRTCDVKHVARGVPPPAAWDDLLAETRHYRAALQAIVDLGPMRDHRVILARKALTRANRREWEGR